MARERLEDGRVILPRPPAGAQQPESGMPAPEAVQRALEIQLAGTRMLQANAVFRAIIAAASIALLVVVFPLIDVWLFSTGMLDWHQSFAFTAAFVLWPYVWAGARLLAWFLWQRR
jgi:hypothetical protein